MASVQITMLAARRVLPPDFTTPAKALRAGRLHEGDGPASPCRPPAIFSLEDQLIEEPFSAPEPNLKSIASVSREVHDRAHRVLDRVDEARGALQIFFSIPTLNQTGELKAIFWWTMRSVSFCP